MKYLFMQLGDSIEFSMIILNYSVIAIDVILLCIFSWFYFIYFFNSFKKEKPIEIIKPENKFAVLVAARNESKVIRNILDSLKNQSYPKELFKVFIIVESFDDPTVKIVRNYGENFKVVIRKNIGKKRTKGHALNDAYLYIKNHKEHFDAYMIFDADNVVSKDYLLTMNSLKKMGYQIGVGYRNYTNVSTNWISITSGILFSFMNAFTSRGRSKLFNKATLTGTGYYIDSKIVDDAGGWIWNGMTEDVELTYYAYKNNIKMKYYPLVEYYDEQATKYSVLHAQHVRWVWGFIGLNHKKFDNYNFNYNEKTSQKRRFFADFELKLGIYPFLIFVLLELFLFIIGLTLGFISLAYSLERSLIINTFLFSLFHLFIVYISFIIVAIFTLVIDNKNLKLKPKYYVLGALSYPIFFFDFVLAFFDGLFHKNKRKKWGVIEHNGVINNKKLLTQK